MLIPKFTNLLQVTSRNNINCGLTPNDADWVDVIHSGGQRSDIIDLGTMRAMGDVDFYPNDGGQQPGCDLVKQGERPEEHSRPILN